MAQDPKTDRRKSPRFFVRILVDYAASDTYLYDYSNDLSEGGVFIQTTALLEKGEQLDLRFTLPGTDRLFQLRGEVMWVNKYEKEGSQIESEAELSNALTDLLNNATPATSEPSPPPAPALPEGMGIRFINISPEDQAILREFLRKESY